MVQIRRHIEEIALDGDHTDADSRPIQLRSPIHEKKD